MNFVCTNLFLFLLLLFRVRKVYCLNLVSFFRNPLSKFDTKSQWNCKRISFRDRFFSIFIFLKKKKKCFRVSFFINKCFFGGDLFTSLEIFANQIRLKKINIEFSLEMLTKVAQKISTAEKWSLFSKKKIFNSPIKTQKNCW